MKRIADLFCGAGGTSTGIYKGNLSRELADKFTGWRQEFPIL